MRFHKAAFHSVSATHNVRNSGEVLGEEFGNGNAEVLEKGLRLFRIPDNHSGEHRHPWSHIISAAFHEFPHQPGSPVLRPGLITVHHQMPYSMRPEHTTGGILVHVEIMTQICPHGLRIKLVDLQPGCLRRCRMILFPCQGCTETIDYPPAFGDIPVKDSIMNCIRENHDFPGSNSFMVVRRRIIVQVMGGCEGGFLFGMIDPVFGIKPELRHK